MTHSVGGTSQAPMRLDPNTPYQGDVAPLPIAVSPSYGPQENARR